MRGCLGPRGPLLLRQYPKAPSTPWTAFDNRPHQPQGLWKTANAARTPPVHPGAGRRRCPTPRAGPTSAEAAAHAGRTAGLDFVHHRESRAVEQREREAPSKAPRHLGTFDTLDDGLQPPGLVEHRIGELLRVLLRSRGLGSSSRLGTGPGS